MSEAALTKVLKDIEKLEGELAVFKNTISLAESSEKIISYITSQPEPFLAGRTEQSPWHAGGGGGGCIIA